MEPLLALSDAFAITLLDWIIMTNWVLLPIVVLKAIVIVAFAGRHVYRHRHFKPISTGPLVSIIVPCYNEEVTLARTIDSLLSQVYQPIQIIVVDDGSTDQTLQIAKHYARRNENVFYVTKENAGKAKALNAGFALSEGEIICTVDADSLLDAHAITWLVPYYKDPKLSGVGGNVKVVNRRGLMAHHQALEYIVGLNLQRRMFATLGALQVTSGALGSFRRTHLEAIGGFPEETIVEDMDVTVTLGLAGGKVEFETRALAYTEAPEDLKGWIKQRHRWTVGGLQVCAKHKQYLFRHNRLGRFGLPFFVILPWIDVTVTFVFLFTVLRTILLETMLPVLIAYTVLTFVSVFMAICAIRFDNFGERKHMSLMVIPDGLWYFHMTTLMVMKSMVDFARGKTPAWNKLDRKGYASGLPFGEPIGEGAVLAQGVNTDRVSVFNGERQPA